MKIQNNSKQIALFLTAQTISLFGSSLVQYAIIWYIALSTGSGAMMTIATLSGFLPQIFLSFFAGVWIDRYDRKKIIMLSDSLIAVATLAVALCFLAGYTNVWLLFAALVIRSAGTGVQNPAVNAFIPQITPASRLMRVNGIYNTINALMMFLPPAISALILTFASLESVFFIDVFTAVIGVWITSFIRAKPYKSEGEDLSGYLHQLKQGLTYLKNHTFIRRLLVYQFAVMFLISPAAFLTVLLVSRTFGPEMWRLSLNEITFGGGAILGGALFTWWNGFKEKIHTTLVTGFLYGILMLAMGLTPFFIPYLVINLIIGVLLPFYNTPITVLLQERVSANMHGRVFAFMNIVISSALPLGMVAFGPLADVLSVQHILIGCGLFLGLLSAGVYTSQKLSV